MKRKAKAVKEPVSPPAPLGFLISLPVILLVVAFYFWTAISNGNLPEGASNYYYPLLGRAFAEGQLYLDVKPAPELLALSDPYDPNLNKNYRLHDAVLYHGKYYIYFGPTPAVLLFAPYFVLTYTDFPQKVAVALFCSLGFVLSALLFLMILRDHFPGVPRWLKLACVLSLGMANACPFLIRRPDVYEAAISCAYFCLQLVFLSFYCAVRQGKRKQAMLWLLLSSACLGAAAGARPNYILVVPLFIGFLVWLWRQRVAAGEPRAWSIFWALAPVSLVGLLLAAYNYARFDNPFDFGTNYQLAGVYMSKTSPTRLADLPYSLWYYFFFPPHYGWQFPFIHALPLGRLERPDKSYSLEPVTGLFVSAPISLFVLALPILLRKAIASANRPLALTAEFLFLTSLALLFTILRVPCPTMRYLVDFAPTFLLLGCVMVCYFYAWIARQKQVIRWPLQGLLIVIILAGCVNGLFLSFTGYYDFLQFGSPDTYAALGQFFSPLEMILKTLAGSP